MKYYYGTSFYFNSKKNKINFANNLKAIVTEHNKNKEFKKIIAYCETEEDAELITNALNEVNK